MREQFYSSRPAKKEQDSEVLNDDVAKFLASGGEIQEVAQGASGVDLGPSKGLKQTINGLARNKTQDKARWAKD